MDIDDPIACEDKECAVDHQDEAFVDHDFDREKPEDRFGL